MTISGINPINTLQTEQIAKTQINNNKKIFDGVLKKSLDDINNNINQTNKIMNNIMEGNNGNIQDYIISSQKTEMSIQLTLQVRNQVINSYKEIMKMQV